MEQGFSWAYRKFASTQVRPRHDGAEAGPAILRFASLIVNIRNRSVTFLWTAGMWAQKLANHSHLALHE